MNSSDVARYLNDHPEFFEEHMDLLARIKVKHPHGTHAIPLIERQVMSLREKSRQLEGNLRELITFGEQNDVTSERLHRMTLDMLAAPNMFTLLQTIDTHLRENFGLDASAVRFWGGDDGPVVAEFSQLSDEARAFGESLEAAHLSAEPKFDSSAWFGEPIEQLASYAYVPLRAEKPFGLLVFASKDPNRFTPEMGTHYLKRLGELVSMALRRFLD